LSGITGIPGLAVFLLPSACPPVRDGSINQVDGKIHIGDQGENGSIPRHTQVGKDNGDDEVEQRGGGKENGTFCPQVDGQA